MRILKKSIILSLLLCALLTCSILFICSCDYHDIRRENTSITDIDGREVQYPREVEKIATVGCAARVVVYAGAQNKLVGITEMDRPNVLRPYTIAYQEIFSSLPTTSEGNHINATNIDKEKLLELNPDVIFSSRTKNENEELQNKLKIPVIGIGLQDEVLKDDAWKVIKIVGDVCGTDAIANRRIGFLKNIYEEVNKSWNVTSPLLYRGAVNYKGSKDLTGTFSHYCVFDALRATNVADRPDFEGEYDTTLEQILAWNPDYIFMDYENKNKVAEQINSNPDVFSQLKAFKNQNVYFVPPINSNGSNVEYGLCEAAFVAKTIYPDIYSQLSLEQEYSEIFEVLLGKNIYPELVNRGLVIGKASF